MDPRARLVLDGDVRTAARLMRDLDDGLPRAVATLKELYPHTGRAFVLGITGNPGAGKSTVVDGLLERLRRQGRKVGVVAVDPSSPFTGGAILGDRIRMQRHATDPGVFIRSLATRGHLGGLSRSTADVVLVLDAIGCDVVIIETVGVGQDEVDVITQADTTVVVTVPGLGDEIQAIKAGILEIADVLLVNKADREGAERTVRHLLAMLELRPHEAPPVEIIKAVASSGQGLDELLAAIQRHHALQVAALGPQPPPRRRRRAAAMLGDVVEEQLGRLIRRSLDRHPELIDRIAARELDPYSAAETLLDEIRRPL